MCLACDLIDFALYFLFCIDFLIDILLFAFFSDSLISCKIL